MTLGWEGASRAEAAIHIPLSASSGPLSVRLNYRGGVLVWAERADYNTYIKFFMA